jgi:hypothetical protein
MMMMMTAEREDDLVLGVEVEGALASEVDIDAMELTWVIRTEAGGQKVATKCGIHLCISPGVWHGYVLLTSSVS